MADMLLAHRLANSCFWLGFGRKVLVSSIHARSGLHLGGKLRTIQPPCSRSRHQAPALVAGLSSASGGMSLDPSVEEVVDKIHSTPFKFVLFVTGGASQAASWLLAVPGASRTVLEIRVPYAPGSLSDILGAEPASYASPETALAMAKAAYRHAANLSPFGTDIVGVGCTCALATDRSRKGEHKAYVATYSGTSLRQYSLVLSKGARDRFHEDATASRLLLGALADAAGINHSQLDLGLLQEGGQEGATKEKVQVETHAFDHTAILQELLNGRVDCVEFSGGNVYVDAPRRGRIYLPGSFNPLHDGHKELLQAACRVHPNKEGCFELSIGNADKGFLPLEEIARRVAQFTHAGLPLVVTQAPLFTMKADLFRDSLFVVGYDTAVRLVRAEYYGDETAMLLQFAKLKHQGCGFLVAGRSEEGRFMTLSEMPMPPTLQRGGMFEAIPEAEFRSDISSTELRARGQGLASTISR